LILAGFYLVVLLNMNLSLTGFYLVV